MLPRRALDLGCGTGSDAVYLAQRGIETTGIDGSSKALQLARERAERSGVEVTWVEGDVLDLPLGDASFDLVTDHGCLHHIATKQQATYASEVARVLEPGGTLLIREKNHGHHELAATEDSIRTMIAGTLLRAVSVVPYETGGSHGAGRATITVLRRD